MKSGHQLHGSSTPPPVSARSPQAGANRPALVAVAMLLLVVMGVGTWAYTSLSGLPDPGHESVLAKSIVLYDRNGQVLGERNPEGRFHLVLHLKQMGRNGPAATLAAEDRDFYKHGAVNATAVFRALVIDASLGRPAQGGSTISQQLVKIEALSSAKSAHRKAQEVILAYQLENRYSKDQILEMYLNRVYYGHGAYGIGSATKTYFGADRSPSDLTPAQAAFLAGLLAAPSYYDPFLHYDRARARQLYVLHGMVETTALTAAEAQKAEQEDVRGALRLDLTYRASKAPHFQDYVIGRLEQELGAASVQQGGLAVYTTLDPNLQALAEKSVTDGVRKLASTGVNNGDLLAARPDTGEILAWVGSKDYTEAAIGGQYDVILAPRQPGSSFKPYVYEAALRDKKITVDSQVHDVPTDFNGYKPQDFDNRYLGTLCVKQALLRSRNIPAVEVARTEGIQNVNDLARSMGITHGRLPNELQTAIGGGDVTMLDHVQGYQVFANQGQRVALNGISRIVDRNGNTVYKAPTPAGTRVLSAQETYLMTWMLKDYQATWSFGWNRQLASKTGTSGAGGVSRDSWIMAYSPDIVAGAWVGNTGADGKGGTVTVYGEQVASSLMAEFVNGLPPTFHNWYRAPAGLTTARSGSPMLPGTENLPGCAGASNKEQPGNGNGKGNGKGNGQGDGGDD